MTRDITNEIKAAFEKSTIWSPQKCHDYLRQILNRVSTGVEDWDKGAGENWARVLFESKPVAYINANLPLIFIRQDIANLLPLFPDAIVLLFDDEDAELFLLERDIFSQWSQGKSDTGAFSPESFSVSDLWWATV
jgi:hypothetical protein